MRKVNPLKLTLIVIPLAIVLTMVIRYFFDVVFGASMHPALTLVIYIAMFTLLKIISENLVRGGKLAWLSTEEN